MTFIEESLILIGWGIVATVGFLVIGLLICIGFSEIVERYGRTMDALGYMNEHRADIIKRYQQLKRENEAKWIQKKQIMIGCIDMDKKIFWFFLIGLTIGFGICFFLGLYNVATHPMYYECIDKYNYCAELVNSYIRFQNINNLSIFKP